MSPGQILPDESRFRVIRASDPRPLWRAGEIRPSPGLATDDPGLRDEMGFARGCESFFYVVDPVRLVHDCRLRRFPGWYGPTGFPIALVRELAEGLTLEHFIQLVQEGILGMPGSYLFDRSDQPPTDQLTIGLDTERLPAHHATAYAVERTREH